MTKVFLSYRREDSAQYALNVSQYLERLVGAGNVFLDIDKLDAGERFAEALEGQLQQSSILIAIIGPNWIGLPDSEGRRRIDDPADWVRLEIGTALSKKIKVVPLLVGGAKLPERSLLPGDIAGLVDYQSFVLTAPSAFKYEIAALASQLDLNKSDKPYAKLGVVALFVSIALFFVLAFGAYLFSDFMQPSISQSVTETNELRCVANAQSANEVVAVGRASSRNQATEMALQFCRDAGGKGCELLNLTCR